MELKIIGVKNTSFSFFTIGHFEFNEIKVGRNWEIRKDKKGRLYSKEWPKVWIGSVSHLFRWGENSGASSFKRLDKFRRTLTPRGGEGKRIFMSFFFFLTIKKTAAMLFYSLTATILLCVMSFFNSSSWMKIQRFNCGENSNLKNKQTKIWHVNK